VEFAAALPLSVGVVRAGAQGVHSVILKLTYDLRESGAAAPSRNQEPLTAGRANRRGAPLAPSDFSGPKSACDVALVGLILDGASSPVSLTAADLEISCQSAAAGPVEPTRLDPQFAPLERRIPFPNLPLPISVRTDKAAMHTTVPGPQPLAGLVRRRSSRLVPLDLWVDGVLLDPFERRVTLLYKGVFHHPSDIDRDLFLVIDASGSLPHLPFDLVAGWPRYECEETVGAISDDDEQGDTATSAVDEEKTGQIQVRRLSGDDEETTGQIVIERPAPPAVVVDDDEPTSLIRQVPQLLERQKSGTVPMPERPPVALAPQGIAPPAPTFGPPPTAPTPLVRSHSETALEIPIVSEAPLPFQPPRQRTERPPPPAPRAPMTTHVAPEELRPADPLPFTRVRAETAPISQRPVMQIGTPFELPTYERERLARSPDGLAEPTAAVMSSANQQAPNDPRIEGFTLTEFAALRAELWSGLALRRAILRGRGLSELRWRTVERAWSHEIDRMMTDPELLATAVGKIRSVGSAALSLPGH